MGVSLVINPGSTSTKFGIFSGIEKLLAKTLTHSERELEHFENIVSQKDYRAKLIVATLEENGFSLKDVLIVIAIGGLIRPGPAGVYRVNARMLNDLSQSRYDEHASNLGALIADYFAQQIGVKAYIADAVTVDEMVSVARLSGIPEITRLGRSHTLNQKYMARQAAKQLGIPYEKASLVVAHLGGGISVTAHKNGKMVDTNAARGEGPFSIDRAGGVNSYELVKMCFSGSYSRSEMLKKINGNGGVVAYLGTRNFRDVEKQMLEGNSIATEVFYAMAYQISKEIAAMTVPLGGHVDSIVLTGGMSNSKKLCKCITDSVSYLANVIIYPGECELEALAKYADEILSGELTPLEY